MVRSHWLRVCGTRLISRPYQTRFRSGSGTPIPLPRRAPQLAGLFYKRHAMTPVRHDILSVQGFRFYFTPFARVLFAFPSRYFFPIGSYLVFSLRSWSTWIQAGFLVPRPTQVSHHGAPVISVTGLSPPAVRLSSRFSYDRACFTPRVIPMRPCNPASLRFGLLPLRSPLLRESLLISFPELLRWFTSLSMTPAGYFIHPSGTRRLRHAGYPIRTSMNHRICAPPHGFSQLITSFVAL